MNFMTKSNKDYVRLSFWIKGKPGTRKYRYHIYNANTSTKQIFNECEEEVEEHYRKRGISKDDWGFDVEFIDKKEYEEETQRESYNA